MSNNKKNIVSIKTSDDVKGEVCTSEKLEFYVDGVKIDGVTSVSLGTKRSEKTIEPSELIEATITLYVNLG